MTLGWWVAGLLLIALAGLFYIHRKIKEALWQEQVKVNKLENQLDIASQELSELKTRRKKLLAAATQGLLIVEQDGMISSSNKVARQLFGKPSKNATLMSWTRHHQLQELVTHTLKGEKMPPLYCNYNERTLEAHARFIKENGQVVAVAVAIHDVTELEQLSRSRRDFVANISHELRTPLASLQLLTDTLLGGALDDKKMAYSLFAKIAHQVDSLSQMAQEVLDLSMIESGKIHLRLSMHSLHDIVHLQIENFLPQAQRKNLVLDNSVSKDLSVLVDDRMIGRVVSNLVHNAIKFTDKGDITISAQQVKKKKKLPENHQMKDDWVLVTVSDTGIGLAPDDLTRVFERFYKVDKARDRKEPGTGLGLAIAKYIVEAHGGLIWAEPDDVGATFHFTILTE